MSDKENLALWDRNEKTDPDQTKAITGKDYKGTSPKPHYIVWRLTKEFGPCGLGWGFEIENERFEKFGDESLHIARIKFWYKSGQEKCWITHVGQTKAAYNTGQGKFKVDEDAPKKSVTDALIKCASMLGFAGDIFLGRWDDSKYVNELKNEFAKKPEAKQETGKEFIARIKMAIKENPKGCAREVADTKGRMEQEGKEFQNVWCKFTPEEQEIISNNWPA